MSIGLIFLLTILPHVAFASARVTISLFALHLGATPLTVGVLISLLAVVPMFCSVRWGRQIDRIGNDHLDRVMSAAARMNSMIDALLSLSQLSTRPLASQPVHLSQLAGFILDDLRRASPQRRASCPSASATCWGRAARSFRRSSSRSQREAL